MMLYKVCSVYDEKAEAFLPCSFNVALGSASRDFTDGITKPDSPLGKFKTDFKLYHVADFDDSTGLFSPIIPPRLIISGSDL